MRSPRYSMIRAFFAMCFTAKTPRPCTGELRTSTRSEVAMAGPPFVGCGWLDMSIFFVWVLRAIVLFLNSHRRLDGRMVLIVHDLKVFEGVIENAGRPAVQHEFGAGQRHTRELFIHLREVIGI